MKVQKPKRLPQRILNLAPLWLGISPHVKESRRRRPSWPDCCTGRRLIVLRALDRLMQLDSELTPTETAIDELVEAFQYQLGYSTLRSWNLSDDTGEAARAMDPEAGPPEKTTLRIVQAADHIAKKLGMHPHPDPDLNLMDQDAIEALEISDVEMAALMVDLEDEIDEIRSAFDGA